jgi:hypothetical protein
MMEMNPPPQFIYATHDSDDEDESDDEAGCGRVGYNGDGVDKNIRVDKNILAKEILPSIS